MWQRIRCWLGKHDWRPQFVHDNLFEVCRSCRRTDWFGAATGANDKKRCAYCEGEFSEDSLDYSSGDPACAPCQQLFGSKLKGQ